MENHNTTDPVIELTSLLFGRTAKQGYNWRTYYLIEAHGAKGTQNLLWESEKLIDRHHLQAVGMKIKSLLIKFGFEEILISEIGRQEARMFSVLPQIQTRLSVINNRKDIEKLLTVSYGKATKHKTYSFEEVQSEG